VFVRVCFFFFYWVALNWCDILCWGLALQVLLVWLLATWRLFLSCSFSIDDPSILYIAD